METETTTTDLQAVMDALQQVYGDASQTVLDQRAASAVLQTLRQRGWASLNDAGALIAAAGGQVVVPPNIAMRDWAVFREDAPHGVRFTALPR